MTPEPSPAGVPAWFPDELANAGRENLDERHVVRCDDKEDADAEQEVRLLQQPGLTGESRLVEFGPGTASSPSPSRRRARTSRR